VFPGISRDVRVSGGEVIVRREPGASDFLNIGKKLNAPRHETKAGYFSGNNKQNTEDL
jgi:hypothetical protein